LGGILVTPPEAATATLAPVWRNASLTAPTREGYRVKCRQFNPRLTANIKPAAPLRVIGNCYMFKRTELEFQNMLNAEINDLPASGFVERQLEKYEKYPNSQLRTVSPYDPF
jgi:hypothetical protein